jgi:hypothetical protein
LGLVASTPTSLQGGPDEQRAQELHLGLDSDHRSHLLITTDEAFEGSTGLAAVSVGSRVLEIDGVTSPMLDVTCEIASLTEVFDHFVVAVAERLVSERLSPITSVLDVIEDWRRFLISAGAPPARDRIAAVFGELLVLRDIVRQDPLRRVDVWVGPYGARHDFRRGGLALEVKTSRSHTAHVVTVHGEDQLLEPENGTLYLHFVRLEEVPEGGESLPGLVDDLLASGAGAGPVFDVVAAAGVPPADFCAAASVRFDVRERLTVPVDDGTPRIVPSSFKGDARPVGVVDIVYRINLDHVLERTLDPLNYDALIGAIATGEAA